MLKSPVQGERNARNARDAVDGQRASTSPIGYRPDVDGLRAVAVLAVVAFHAFPYRLPGGFVGVDVFFVISGYLITSIIVASCLAGEFSIAGFYSRRIRRIFPALTLVLSSVLAGSWFLLSNIEFARLGAQALAGAGFVANLLFWREAGYFDQSAHEKPLLHLWSLGVEEQFYIVWPILVWALWRARKHFKAALSVLFVGSFLLCLVQSNTNPKPFVRPWRGSGNCWRAAFSRVIRRGS